ncbi:MAG: hypothetical protein ABGX25_07325, partial [Nautiliaceae bacterium]
EQEMFITNKVKFEDLPSYEIGMEKGFQDGMEKGMEKGIEKGMEKGILALYKITGDISLIKKELGIEENKIFAVLEKHGIKAKK